MLSITHYLFLSIALMLIGFTGALIRRNLLVRLFSVALVFVAAAIALASFGRLFGDANGQSFSIFVVVTVAIELPVLLAIAAAAFRRWADLIVIAPAMESPSQPDNPQDPTPAMQP
jgi:NADH-quinone oxidoreductase subunit K